MMLNIGHLENRKECRVLNFKEDFFLLGRNEGIIIAMGMNQANVIAFSENESKEMFVPVIFITSSHIKTDWL